MRAFVGLMTTNADRKDDQEDDRGAKPQTGKGRTTWEPPRGIRYFEKQDRPKPYMLEWRAADPKNPSKSRRETKAYKTKGDREIAAKKLAEDRQTHGEVVMQFDAEKWWRYLEFQKIVGEATDPILVAHEWLAARQGIGTSGATGLTVLEAWTKYRHLRVVVEEEKLDADTLRHMDTHVGTRFCGEFGAMRLNEFTVGMGREWLSKLKHPRTCKPLSAVTKNNHLKDVNAMFARAVREGWILRNPFELIARLDTSIAGTDEDDEGGDPMPVRDVFEFFRVNRDSPEIVKVALEAFGGIRYKNAARIERRHLDLEEKGIEMPGRMHKGRRRKFRQGHPDCLWSWMALAADEKHPVWAMTLRQYAEAKREALANAKLRPFIARTDEDRAKVKELRNIWRRSFASYMIAKTGEVPTVSYLMQHKRTETTEIYEGRANKRDAALYCAISYENTALTWEAFVAKVEAEAAVLKPAA